MKNNPIHLSALALAGAIATTVSAHAGLIFSIEAPGVQASTVPGVTTEDFNSQPLGSFSGATAVGTLSSGGAIVAPNAYGGSFASDYYAVGTQSGQTQSTLTLTSPQHYFGMWWPAGDAQNILKFYDGATLLNSYNVASLLALSLSPAYFGNPSNPGQDLGEPFVYLDFTTTGTSGITSVEFDNVPGTTGFEMDNFSITDQQIIPPGTQVPDSGSTLLMLCGAAVMLTSVRAARKFAA
jgi:hypothetical protein